MSSLLGKRKRAVTIPISFTSYLADHTPNFLVAYADLKQQITESLEKEDAAGYKCASATAPRSQYDRFFVESLLEELFRYLFLLCRFPAGTPIQVSPSELVDRALHVLLLDPELYYKICDAVMTLNGENATDRPMRVLPHNLNGEKDRDQQEMRYKRTLSEYVVVFQHTAPANIWPPLVPRSTHTQTDVAFVGPRNERGGYEIFVRAFTSALITLEVDSNFTVYMIKKALEGKLGILWDQQRLICGGKQLEDECALYEYKIIANYTISLALRLRGC